MSISPLSSVLSAYSSTQGLQGSGNSRRQDLTELANALQSGNLSEAQQAYSALQQAGGPPAGSGSNSSPVSAVFKALGQALASGNLSQAQGAFSQLQSDMKGTAGAQGSTSAHVSAHHHHHHGGRDAEEANATTSSSATSPGTTASSATGTTSGSINLLG